MKVKQTLDPTKNHQFVGVMHTATPSLPTLTDDPHQPPDQRLMHVLDPSSTLNSAIRATNTSPEHISQRQLCDDMHEGHRHDQQRPESLCMFEVPLMLKEGGIDRLLEMMELPVNVVPILGGEKAVCRAIESDEVNHSISLRPGHPSAIPVPSQRRRFTVNSSYETFVISVRRTKRDRSVLQTAKVIGKIDTTFECRGLADLELPPFPCSPSSPSQPTGRKVPMLLPSQFLPTLQYSKGIFHFLSSRTKDGKPLQKRMRMQRSAGLACVSCGYGEVAEESEAVMKAILEVEEEAPSVGRKGMMVLKKEVLNHLRTLFLECPMWNRKAIDKSFTNNKRFQAIQMLPMVAYFITNGPWRNYWVCYGYNPYNSAEARFYQIIDFRVDQGTLDKALALINENKKRIMTEKSDEKSEEGLHLFGTKIGRQNFFPLHRITNRRLQQLALSQPILVHTTKEGGWFPPPFISEVRSVLRSEINEKIIKLEMVKINDYRLECPPTDRRVEDQNEELIVPHLSSAEFLEASKCASASYLPEEAAVASSNASTSTPWNQTLDDAEEAEWVEEDVGDEELRGSTLLFNSSQDLKDRLDVFFCFSSESNVSNPNSFPIVPRT